MNNDILCLEVNYSAIPIPYHVRDETESLFGDMASSDCWLRSVPAQLLLHVLFGYPGDLNSQEPNHTSTGDLEDALDLYH